MCLPRFATPLEHQIRRVGLPITVIVLLLTGCPSNRESRLEHYKMGGSYSGAGPSLSGDGTRILYSSPRSGNGDIYSFDIATSKTVRLTDDPRMEHSPDSSPSDGTVVFVVEENGEGDLWLMDAKGQSRQQLTNGNGDEGDPRFSPDGKEIIFWRTVPSLKSTVGTIAAREVFILNTSTGSEERVTNNTVEDAYAVFCPKGTDVVVTRDHYLFKINRIDKRELLLGLGSAASISSDGIKVAFVGGKYGRTIEIMDITGKNSRVVYGWNTTVSHPVFNHTDGLFFLEAAKGNGVGTIIGVQEDGLRVNEVTDTR